MKITRKTGSSPRVCNCAGQHDGYEQTAGSENEDGECWMKVEPRPNNKKGDRR